MVVKLTKFENTINLGAPPISLEMLNWLDENNIKYNLWIGKINAWGIEMLSFENKDDMLMFVIRFGEYI